MEDNQIIELFKNRSEQAINELSQKYGLVCKKVANNILNDQREAPQVFQGLIRILFLIPWPFL